jgi:hypothetical protein
VKDSTEFTRRLGEHFPLPMEWIIGAPVTEVDLEADAAAFLAFAGAFGVKPPKPVADQEEAQALPSSPAS